MPPLKIAHVAEACCGGVGRHLLDLCAGQQSRGHAVTIVYSLARAESAFLEGLRSLEGVEFQCLDMRRPVGTRDALSWWRLWRLMASEGPIDIVHGHSSKAGALVRLLPARPAGARVYTSHALRTMDPTLGGAARACYGAIEQVLTNRRCDALIVGSREEREAALDLGIAPSKIALVPNGITAPMLPSKEQARERLQLPGDPDAPVVGFVGRLVPQKAPERAVRALAALEHPEARLAMLGDGVLEGSIRALAGELGVAERLALRSGLDGQYHMPAFDVLLVPSRYESMGYVFLEATAAGIPIVATPVGVSDEVIHPDRNGSIVPNTDDPRPFAAALRRWLDAADGSGSRVGAPSASVVTADAMVTATLNVYGRAMSHAEAHETKPALLSRAS